MIDIDRYCRMMHDVYEVAAQRNGWQTQEATRVFFDNLPEANKATMREAVSVVLREHRADVLREVAAEPHSAPYRTPPEEPGLVAFHIEMVPHDWANDGQHWIVGKGTPEEVSRCLREAQEVVGFYTAPDEAVAE